MKKVINRLGVPFVCAHPGNDSLVGVHADVVATGVEETSVQERRGVTDRGSFHVTG